MTYRSGVTLVIPTIPPRTRLLVRALKSAAAQTRPFSDIHIAVDLNKEGAGATRTRAMNAVQTEWTAFLDDDDELLPNHLDVLIHAAIDNGADVVFPWFEVVGGQDPFPQFFGKEFDPALPHMFPVTVLARTEMLHRTEGFRNAPSRINASVMEGDDWVMWLNLIDVGAKFLHVPERTWRWHHNGQNTSGLPSRW